MIHLVEVTNPFNPNQCKRQTELPSGKTILDTLKAIHPDFVEFSLPTICLLNGIAMMRDTWTKHILKDKDILVFTALPRGSLLGGVVGIVVTLLGSLFGGGQETPSIQPTRTNETPEADPVFSLSGRQNRTRLSTPIQVSYGKTRMWPSFGATPFTQYSGNAQFLYQLFCLGQGNFTINETFIEDTPISQFKDVTIEYTAPGGQVTLFPDNVETSSEVGSIELLASNEVGAGIVGPFVANTAFTLANVIEIDVTLPQGLYFSNDAGNLDSRTALARFNFRPIDDSGAPLGPFVLLVQFTKTLNTNTPQRFTLSIPVTPGRYEVTGERNQQKDQSHRAGHTIVWETMRAFLPSTKDYGDVTMLAIKARATNNLNNKSKNRINVDATRELACWNKGTQSFDARAPTSSIVWDMEIKSL